MATLYKYTRQQLKELKAKDFKDGDMVDVIDKNGDIIYTINIAYGIYSIPLATTVNDKNYKLLGCTAGTPNLSPKATGHRRGNLWI